MATITLKRYNWIELVGKMIDLTGPEEVEICDPPKLDDISLKEKLSRKRGPLEDLSNARVQRQKVSDLVEKPVKKKKVSKDVQQPRRRSARLAKKTKSRRSQSWCIPTEGLPVNAGPGCPLGYHSLPLPEGVTDIDLKHLNDPAYNRSYVKDIYSYLRSLQYKYPISPAQMQSAQVNVTPHMRSILIDWLVEVVDEFRLCSDTFFLAVNYIDRYLQLKPVSRRELQLLGCTCLWIAAKYEEIYSPTLDEFVMMSDNSYKKVDLLKMEGDVLNTLDFKLTVSTAKNFLRRFQRASQVKGTEKFLCNYLSELSLIDDNMRQFSPSILAASALYLARFELYGEELPYDAEEIWTKDLQHYTGYSVQNLAICVRQVHYLQLHAPTSSLTALYDKYMHNGFDCVAGIIPPPISHLPKP